MIEISVCDDDSQDLLETVRLLDEIMSVQNTPYRLHSFQSPDEMINSLEKIDIGVLDIAMKGCNGIELGLRIRERFPEVKLIYTTVFEEYCIQTINDVHAFSFLCKPLNRDEMAAQLLAALDTLPDNGPEKIFYDVTDRRGKLHPVLRLRLKDILYFEYIKRQRRAAIVLKNQTYICKCTFEKLIAELSPFDFAVNSRGILVNLRHVEKIQGNVVCLDNGRQLPIAQKRKCAFRESLNAFLQKNL